MNKWKKFVSYYKPYKKTFFADMFFACLGAGVTLVLPLIIRYITNEVIYYEPGTALPVILKLAAVLILLVLLECYCNYFIGYVGHVMGAKMEKNMREEIFGHFQKLSFSYYDNQKIGQLMSRITNDLFEITELFHHGPENIVISVIKLVGSLIILLTINWKLTVAVFAVLPFLFVFAKYYNTKMKQAFKQNRARIADINAQIEDSLAGIRVVKSFANEEIEIGKFREGNERFLESKKNSYRYMATFHAGLGAFMTLITIIVIVAGALMMTNGSLEVTDLVTFLLYINNFTQPIRVLIDFTEMFQNGMSGFERFIEILSIHPDIKDKEGAVTLDHARGDISFENVAFRYEEGLEDVFVNLNLEVKAGEYIALVGPSGVGKTTLCSLIPRFYEVSEGCVRVDGVDVRDVALKSLRNQIGIVQQDVYLFTGSVYENIRYGKPDATEEEIIEAAKNANAHDFIMSLPDGYDTYIGQRGVKLSGGQKQRLSLARVFLKNPPILIFDEATSALDNESEQIVQESLEKLAHDRTTFVIAHRLSTIRNAGKILVLTEKGIEESGSHEELLAAGGIYSKLYQMQFAKNTEPCRTE